MARPRAEDRPAATEVVLAQLAPATNGIEPEVGKDRAGQDHSLKLADGRDPLVRQAAAICGRLPL